MWSHRNYFLITFIFIILTTLLLNGSSQKFRRPSLNRNEHLVKISISKSNSNSGNGISKDFFITITEPNIIHFFKNMMDKAEKESLKNPIANADYDIHLTFSTDSVERSEWIHLYLGNKGERSAFIYHGDYDLAYFTLKKDTEILHNLLMQ